MIEKIIILFGSPGAGKGTQGAILSKDLGVPHISTGDIFRKMVDSESSESKMLNQYMQAGKLVPTDLANKIVRKYILSDECKKGVVLDGYPRNLNQAEYFFENISTEIIAIMLDVEDDVVTKRILGRFNCTNCAQLYNKFFDKPKKEGVCDKCGSHQFNYRKDDDIVTVTKRLEEYKKETLPMIEYYKDKNQLYNVNANVTKEEIHKELISVVKKI